jgi:RNA polymerase sigma factor (TIGR02999 family)
LNVREADSRTILRKSQAPPAPGEVTRLLDKLNDGDLDAIDALVPLVYRELRRLAAAALRRERSGHTLDATSLVHEAYLRLVGQDRAHWKSRGHFFAVTAHMMRRVLVDHARRRLAVKRGEGDVNVTLADVHLADRMPDRDTLLGVDVALDRLGEENPRLCRLVELRYFVGLSEEEIASLLEVSVRTVRRDWRFAKAWLRRELGGGPGPAPAR